MARSVSIGAINYADLSQNRVMNIVCDWYRMLALDGDSAPYLQYTYVRARGILRKGGDRAAEGPFDPVATGTPAEWALVLALGNFPEVVAEALQGYYPHVVANYLFALAQGFHGFYHDVPVLPADFAALRRIRVHLLNADDYMK